MRRNNLWEQVPEPDQPRLAGEPLAYHTIWMRDGRVDEKQLLACIRHRLALNLGGNAEASLFVLQDQVWEPLQRNVYLWSRLIQTREVGKWLLRIRVALAHSLLLQSHWWAILNRLHQMIRGNQFTLSEVSNC